VLKGILCLDMLMGRLEIVAFLIFFYPPTWLGQKRGV
jgi:trk system potassium uptake protein TrkH